MLPRRISGSCRPLLRTFGAILLAVATLGSFHGASSQALTPAQYEVKLAAVQAAAEAYALHPPLSLHVHSGTSGTASIVAALAPIVRCTVLMPSVKSMPETLLIIDNRPTLATLKRADREADSARRNRLISGLRDQLTLMRAQAQAATSFSVQTQHGAQTARAVLSDQEFASDPVPPPGYLERQMDKAGPWIDEQLRKLARLFHAAPPPDVKIDPRVPLGILITVAVIAGGLLLAFIARLVAGANWARYRQSRTEAAESGLALTEEEAGLVAARDFDQLLALARRRADEGDFRSAFRLVYLASLVTLDRQGVVRLNKSRTNWEYLRAVRQHGSQALYHALLPMTRGFDRIWYGLCPATRTDYEQALTEHADLRAQAGGS